MTPRARRRRLAQHFLEPAWVEKLVEAIRPARGEAFLEIGSGFGALTLALAARGARVTAVEIDADLAAGLAARAAPRVSVVTADFLKLDLRSLGLPAPVRAVGNLPYNVSAKILIRLLRFGAHGAGLTDATLMLQSEVADRVTAAPGSRDWGPLAIATGLHAAARRLMTLPPGAFRPMPRVRSAVVGLRFQPPPVRLGDAALFDALVRAVFLRRRKTALNAVRPFASRHTAVPAAELLARAGIDPARRPEQLGLAELAALAEVLAASRGRRDILPRPSQAGDPSSLQRRAPIPENDIDA